MWRLVVVYLGAALAMSLAAHLGILGLVIFGGLSVIFAASLRDEGWSTPWPYIVGFWLLPCVPTLVLSYRHWARMDRARRGSRLHRSDARVIARPLVPFCAVLAWLAARPPHDDLGYDRTVSAVLAGAALLGGAVLVVLDLVDLRATRSLTRDAAEGGPLAESREGVPVFDFGVGEASVERDETTSEGYRGTIRPLAIYRGNGAEAVAILTRSAAWSAASVGFTLVATGEVIRQTLIAG